MNIIKKIIDSNGTETFVQGVGYTYDEDVNSIAIGKDTVASGQDQFVFGRKNVEDANKAEIVGGSKHNYPFYPGQLYKQNLEQEGGYYYGGTTISELRQAFKTMFGIEDDDAIQIIDNSGNITPIMFFIATKYIESTSTTGHVSLMYFASNGKSYDHSQYCFVDGNLSVHGMSHSSVDATIGNREMAYSLESHYDICKVQEVNANIRTLDWDGNEKLAGKLEVGGGEVKVGSTTVTEAQLIALLALLPTQTSNEA